MKTKRFLFLLPLVALASCSTLGQSISRDRALELAGEFEEEEFALLDNSFEARLNVVTASGKDEEKRTSNSSVYVGYNVLDKEKDTSELIYKINQKLTSDGEVSKSKLEVYIAKDKEMSDDNNTYYMGYAMQQKDDEDPVRIAAYQSDDASRFAQVQSLSSGAASYLSLIATYLEPVSFIESYGDDADALKEQGITINYYSSGNKNLAFKYEYKIPKESEEAYKDQEDAEYTKSSSLVVEYSNSRFTKMESTSVTNLNNKSVYSLSIKYKSSLKVSMPSGWDNYLED